MARILIADDHPAHVARVRDRLKSLNHDVVEAFNRAETLQCLESRYHRPDLLLLDIGMPDEPIERILELKRVGANQWELRKAAELRVLMGISIYQETRRRFPNVRVVILSASPEADIRKRALGVPLDCPILTKDLHSLENIISIVSIELSKE